jgi:hypothetical protein
MVVTDDTSQFSRDWLKEDVPENIPFLSVTDETFQSPIGWFKKDTTALSIMKSISSKSSKKYNASLPPNIVAMVVTDDTSQSPMGWLKEDAPINMSNMILTDDTSHGLVERRCPTKHILHVINK